MVLPSCTRPVVVSNLPLGQIYTLRSLSNVKSAREKLPSSRWLMCQTGICGVIPLPMSQLRNLPVPIGGISSDPFGLKSQSFISPLDHSFRRRNLVVGSGGGGFHIDDHCVLDVDQVIEPIAELHALVGLRRPSRAWIHRRDHPWSSISIPS